MLCSGAKSTGGNTITAAGLSGYKTMHVEARGYGQVQCLDLPVSLFLSARQDEYFKVPRISDSYAVSLANRGDGKIWYDTGSDVMDGIRVYGLM